MSNRKQIVLSAFLVVAAAAIVAFRLRSGETNEAQSTMEGHNHAAMTAGSGEKKPVVLDPEGARKIGVTFAEVEHRILPLSVRTVGTVAYDETRLATVNPKVSGWVEHLHVDFTGAPIRAGEPLMEVYSPALVSAQEELVLAARLVRDAGEGRALDNARELLASARRRLAYWDIPEDEIRRIEESGEPTKTLTLTAPASGVVVEKNVVEGDRIMPGMTVYRIADLSRVWIEADVFEKDLGLVEEGQRGEASFEAFPGTTFHGRVTYVYPTVSMQTRTGRIRLELSNPDGDLRPGMYARIRLDVPPSEPTLVVPRSAVLSTGERALVFVQAPDGALLPKEVSPGRTSGSFMELLGGVQAGDRIVSSAAFLVDAESNLGTMTGDTAGATGPAGMGGMGHSGHDTGASDAGHSEQDSGASDAEHSGHDIEGAGTGGDAGRGRGVDHSNRD